MDQLGYQRRRNGAYGWGVFEDSASEGRMVETFLVESWLEHLRQRERVTKTDQVLQDLVNQFQAAGSKPRSRTLLVGSAIDRSRPRVHIPGNRSAAHHDVVHVVRSDMQRSAPTDLVGQRTSSGRRASAVTSSWNALFSATRRAAGLDMGAAERGGAE